MAADFKVYFFIYLPIALVDCECHTTVISFVGLLRQESHKKITAEEEVFSCIDLCNRIHISLRCYYILHELLQCYRQFLDAICCLLQPN